MSKMYFKDKDSELCYPRDHFIGDGISEAYEAIREKGSDAFFCRYNGEVGMKGEGNCGVVCVDYKPRNGKSGICVHNGPVYYIGEKVKL